VPWSAALSITGDDEEGEIEINGDASKTSAVATFYSNLDEGSFTPFPPSLLHSLLNPTNQNPQTF
jgi:hypothetical protein